MTAVERSDTISDQPVTSDEAGTAAIRLEHVTKWFPGAAAPAVDDLSMEMAPGAITVLLGPSGCGKTTTLKMINRIIEPTSGRIEVAGREASSLPTHELRRGIGYVFQEIGLFPHRTIADNIATVPRLLGWDRQRIEERVEELIELVGLEPEMLTRYPSALSGGQRQRVGVVRALAADPPVLLMDEPFGAVDPIVRAHLQTELLALQQRLHKTIVLVTHDIEEAIQLGDRVALLNIGGRLEQFGAPAELLRDPANEFVEQFLGQERGLRQLSLVTVADIEPERGPAVMPGASAAEVRAAMEESGLGWALVVDADDRLRGYVDGRDLEGRDSIADVAPRPLRRNITPQTSLREALDAVVSSRTGVVVVVDEGCYRGIIRVEQISRQIVR